MKVKHIVFAVLCVSMVVGALTACGSKTEQPAGTAAGESKSTESTTAAGVTETQSTGNLNFSYNMPNRYKVWLEDLNYWKDMQELSGVTVELVDSGESDDSYYQSIDLAVGSETL